MSCITRGIVRWGLIGGIVLVGTTLVVGPERVAAGFTQIRSKVHAMIDSRVEDPLVLRRQIAEMAKQYPNRIAEVEGELTTVNRQMTQYERDIEIAERVVAMTTEDLRKMKTLVTRAEAEKESTTRPVSLRFDGVRYNLDEAYTEARRINTVRTTYRDRLEQDKQQLSFLNEQRSRLADIREKLESEYNTFQAQLWQLDRQIDAIERNERLIELTEQQQATLEEYERYGTVGNLKQLEGKLAQLRSVQEAQLRTLEQRNRGRDYEGRATHEVETSDIELNDPFSGIADTDEQSEEDSGELRADEKHDEGDRAMAWSGPIVIE